MKNRPCTYREFWPHYLEAHRRPWTRRAHFFATMSGTVCAVTGMVTGEWLLVPAAVVIAFAIAVPSHFLFEGNRPTALRYPLWSALADIEMCWRMATGRLNGEGRGADDGEDALYPDTAVLPTSVTSRPSAPLT